MQAIAVDGGYRISRNGPLASGVDHYTPLPTLTFAPAPRQRVVAINRAKALIFNNDSQKMPSGTRIKEIRARPVKEKTLYNQ